MKKIMTLIISTLAIFIFLSNSPLYTQWDKVEITDPDYQNIDLLDVFFLNSIPNYGWVCGFGGNVMRTTDRGLTWEGTKIQEMQISSSIDSLGVIVYDTTYVPAVNQLESIQFVDTLIGYLSGDNRIFKSTDGGINWKDITIPDMRTWGLFFLNKDTGMVIGGGCDGLQKFYRTEDGGKNWTIYETNESNSGLSDLILYSAGGIGYAASSGLIWRTLDGGKSWKIYSETGERDWQEDIAVHHQSFLVPYSKGCWGGFEGGGIRMSVDLGKNWRDFNTHVSMFGVFLLDYLRGWACGYDKAIYYTSNGGIDWELRNKGLDSLTTLDDIWFINDTLGFVVGNGIYRYHYTNTAIKGDNSNNEISLKLKAYPNPFNDKTIISFNLKENQYVTITITDIFGRKIKQILNTKFIEAGRHKFQFVNKSLPSGIYYCRLITNRYSEILKMIIIK